MSNFISLLDIVYPVGSVIHTFSSASPASTVGGTWAAVNTFLLGSDSAGTEGGEEEHVLSLDEMPAHEHMGSLGTWFVHTSNTGSSGVGTNLSKGTWGFWDSNTVYNHERGSDAAHNNMPPYTTCFIWRRTA